MGAHHRWSISEIFSLPRSQSYSHPYSMTDQSIYSGPFPELRQCCCLFIRLSAISLLRRLFIFRHSLPVVPCLGFPEICLELFHYHLDANFSFFQVNLQRNQIAASYKTVVFQVADCHQSSVEVLIHRLEDLILLFSTTNTAWLVEVTSDNQS